MSFLSREAQKFSLIIQPKFWGWLVALAITLAFGYTAFIAIQYPYALDGNENFILQHVKRYLNEPELKILYPPLTEEPFLANPYPPLFVLVQAQVMRWGDIPLTNGLGRSISVASSVFIAVALYALVKRASTRLAGGLAAVGFIFSANVFDWFLLNRVDAFGLALTLGGIWLLLSGKQPLRWLAIAFFVLAFYTKFTLLAAPLAAVIYLWRRAAQSQALVFGSGFVLLVLGIFFWFNHVTSGQFYIHLIEVNAYQQFYWRKLHLIFQPLTYWPTAFLILPALTYVYQVIARRLPIAPRLEFWLWYLAFAALSLLAQGRSGAGVNFYFEFQLAVIIFGLLTWHELLHNQWVGLAGFVRQQRFGIILFAVINLLLLKNVVWGTQVWLQHNYQYLADYAALAQRLQVLHEGDYYDEQLVMAPFITLRAYLTDSRIFTQLAYKKKWDQQVMLNKIRERDFRVMVLAPGHGSIRNFEFSAKDGNAPLTQEMIEAMRENYEQREVLADRVLYYPKPR